jgi:uncharacterized membrane protein
MIGPLLRGYAVVTLCGWAVFPFLHVALGRLPDRGYAASRCFGLLLASWLSFLAVAVLGSPLTTPVALGVLAAVGVASWVGRRVVSERPRGPGEGAGEKLLEFVRRRGRIIACVEGLALVGTFVFLRIQSYNPAVDPDSERFMDYAFLKAYLRSPGLPVDDPWYAGEPMNYYHFGYAVAAFLVRASGTEASDAFIVCIAILYGLLWTGSFGVGLALTGRSRGGFAAAIAVLGAGNLEWIRQWREHGGLVAFDWFSSSRVIEGTINEFPWFSLLWGDLHPYVIGLPLFVCALTIPLAEALAAEDPRGGTAKRAVRARALSFVVAAGAVLATHAWDFPVLLIASVCVLMAGAGRRRPLRALVVVVLGVLSILVFLPFLSAVDQARRGVGWVGTRSRPDEWGLAFGPFLLLAFLAPLVLWSARQRMSGDGTSAAGPDGAVRGRVAMALACAACLAALACEVVYVPDVFETTPLVRMNTVFKLHRLAWLLLGLSVPFLLERLAMPAPVLRRWAAKAVILLAAGGAAVYPILGTAAWIRWREDSTRPTTPLGAVGAGSRVADAEALFRALYPGDAAAASYLARNARPGEAILEETGEPYTWSSRISTFSGVPAVLGWGNHEAGWRQGWNPILRRRADVDAIYRDPLSASSRELLRRRSIVWVVVGERERRRYGEAGPAGFESIARQVLNRHGTALYRVGD